MYRPSIIIREIEDTDLANVMELINLRDGRNYSAEAIRHTVYGPFGSKVRVWVALVDGKLVGMTGWIVKKLRQGENNYIAGYWQNLFVHPNYRRLMLYPLLVSAMFKGAKESGLDFIYNANRRLEVWQAHLKLGFVKIGELDVLLKPLQPLELLRKTKKLPNYINVICKPIDSIYSFYLQAQNYGRGNKNIKVEQIPWQEAELEDLCGLINEDANHRLHQVMTVDLLKARYKNNLEEETYIIWGIKEQGHLVAALIYRAGLRGNQIYTGVIMDIIVTHRTEKYIPVLLSVAEAYALKSGCEVILYLDGLGEKVRSLMNHYGYFNAPEKYVMLIWPKFQLLETPLFSDLSQWRFSFADHDAF